LYRFFTGLSDKLRLPMVLRYVEGLSVQEIASILRLPQGTVKTRLKRGRERMQQDSYFQDIDLDINDL
ncbi:MAG: sigma factor-like helix-turn-helix DNA-binding protein, partial [Aristaeellaceae bacterium]